MAQKYLEFFMDSAETQYASDVAPLFAIGAANQAVKFAPVAIQGNETQNTNPTFAIQRFKRTKAADSVQSSADNKMGDNLTARLNKAEFIGWDTVETKVATKRDLLVRTSRDKAHDVLADVTGYERTIANGIKNRLIEGEEKAIAAVVAASGASAGTLDVSTKDKIDESIDKVFGAIEDIQLLVDDFKAYTDNVVAFIHPKFAYAMNKAHGKTYYGAPDTFPNQPKSFMYNNIKFIVAPVLNSIAGGTATEVIGAIVLDTEAYANGGLDLEMKTFDQTFLDERVVGHSYAELNIAIDPSRIKHFEIANTASKKVND